MSLPNEFSEASPSGKGAASRARLSEKSQLDFDIDFFSRVLERNAEYVDVLRCQGQLLSRKGRHREAVAVDRQLVALRPNDAVAHYNLGCSLALLGKPKEAIQSLRRAFERGYNDFDHLEEDGDLESLRALAAYRALLREFGIGEG